MTQSEVSVLSVFQRPLYLTNPNLCMSERLERARKISSSSRSKISSTCQSSLIVVGWRLVTKYLTRNIDVVTPPPNAQMDKQKSDGPDHDARAVANYLLDLILKDGKKINQPDLLRLLYFCHGYMLGINGRPLFRQPIEVGRYGPVIRDIRNELIHYGSNPIEQKLFVANEEFDQEERRIIEAVYKSYGELDPVDLMAQTYLSENPYYEMRENNKLGEHIPNKLLEEYFRSNRD